MKSFNRYAALLFWIVPFFFNRAYAQVRTPGGVNSLAVVGSDEIDTTFRTQMNTVFSNLDKSKVPYGYLRDYAMEFTNLENYSGSSVLADSNSLTQGIFWDIYKTIITGRISNTATGIMHPDTLANRWFAYRKPGRITLSGLYFKYSRFKENAANNQVTITNNQLYDKFVSGVWQNPYQTEQVFAVSPSVNVYDGLSFQVLLPADLFITNSNSTISSISINTGSGYVAVTPGVAIPVTYTTVGEKEWTYRLSLTDGSVLYSHSSVNIINSVTSIGVDSAARTSTSAIEKIDIEAAQSYLGVRGKGRITIQYGINSFNNVTGIYTLRKPLIVVEGFDPGHITNPEKDGGETNLTFFTKLVDNSKMLREYTYRNYDIIYVDWYNGTDYIQRNGFLLEAVIRWVNANKEPGSNGVIEQNVILGQSMGGLCARYALKEMENRGERHQTKLFISYDSPQQGANVPQGYQHFANHVKSSYVSTGFAALGIEIKLLSMGNASIYQQLNLANTPAALQMLINHVDNSDAIDNTVHAQWQTELKTMGYPVGFNGAPLRKVAVSNGSECTITQPFSPGADLLKFSGTAKSSVLTDILGSVIMPVTGTVFHRPDLFLSVLPGKNTFVFDMAIRAQASGTSNEVYKCKMTFSKKIMGLINVTTVITNRSSSSGAGTLPYDYFPGGTYNVSSLGVDMHDIKFSNWAGKANITASSQPYFCFVPTVSALDIGKGTTALTTGDYLYPYNSGTFVQSPRTTPFANFLVGYSPNDYNPNQLHISIPSNDENKDRSRNGEWLAGELQGNPLTNSCSNYCGTISIPYITGPTTPICGPQTYTASVPASAGTTFAWSTSKPEFLTLNPTGNQVVITGASVRTTATLKVTVTNSCGAYASDPGYTVRIGAPEEPLLTNVTIVGYPYYGISANVITDELGPYKWYIDGILKKTTTVKSSDIITGGQCGVQHYVQVEVTNACGIARNVPLYFTNTCTMGSAVTGVLISPNPASSSINVAALESGNSENAITNVNSIAGRGSIPAKNKQLYFIRQIKIYDVAGVLRKTFNYNNPSNTQTGIDVSDLSTGIYFLETITNLQTIKRQKFLIVR